LHVFGHIHEGYGREEEDSTIFVNASTCDLRYRPSQPPIIVDLEVKGKK
jgi:Icc-related predicted phosphoesterase